MKFEGKLEKSESLLEFVEKTGQSEGYFEKVFDSIQEKVRKSWRKS